MTHEEFLTKQRARLVEVATSVLVDDTGLIEGARDLLCCLREVADDSDPLLQFFEYVVFESDGLPLGSVREQWATDALAVKDAERLQYEAMIRDEVYDACRKVVARYEQAV